MANTDNPVVENNTTTENTGSTPNENKMAFDATMTPKDYSHIPGWSTLR